MLLQKFHYPKGIASYNNTWWISKVR